MSLASLVVAVLAPFRALPGVDHRRLEQQLRDSDVLLQQLRAELRLMRRWKAATRSREDR